MIYIVLHHLISLFPPLLLSRLYFHLRLSPPLSLPLAFHPTCNSLAYSRSQTGTIPLSRDIYTYMYLGGAVGREMSVSVPVSSHVSEILVHKPKYMKNNIQPCILKGVLEGAQTMYPNMLFMIADKARATGNI